MTKKAKKVVTTTGLWNEDFSSTNATWEVRMATRPASPSEPEDHGTVFSEAPFTFRLRFAVNTAAEPTVNLYTDMWHNGQRRWVQQGAQSYLLSTLKRLMVLLDKELTP